MDSKKYYKKFGTIFWWTLTILPFLLIIWSLMVALFNYNRLGGSPDSATNILTYISNILGDDLLVSCNDFIMLFTPNIILEPMTSLFETIFGGVSGGEIGIILAYMVWISLLHVLFDFLTFIPNLIHKFLESWGNYKQ